MLRAFLSPAIVFLLAAASLAANDVSVTTLLEGLHDPCGVAVRPAISGGDFEIFVAEAGTGRIIRVRSERPGVGEAVINGFTPQPAGATTSEPAHLGGLLFLDRTRLIVTGSENGHGCVRVYALADEKMPLAAEDHEQQLNVAASAEPRPISARGFSSAARTRTNDRVADMLILAASPPEAGLWKATLRAGSLEALAVFAAGTKMDEANLGRGIAVSPQGYVVAAVQLKNGNRAESRMHFYNPISGRAALEHTVNLSQIVGLAYSPRTGNLYAAGFAAHQKQGGGVFRIEDRPPGQSCAVEKIADVPGPRGLAFDADRALYVITTEHASNGEKVGRLLKLSGEF